jgi:hypothetical protein
MTFQGAIALRGHIEQLVEIETSKIIGTKINASIPRFASYIYGQRYCDQGVTQSTNFRVYTLLTLI